MEGTNCQKVLDCVRPKPVNDKFICQITVDRQQFDWKQPYNASRTSTGNVGTGFLLGELMNTKSNTVFVITAHHVVESSISIKVHLDVFTEPRVATLYCFNPDLDVAFVGVNISEDEREVLFGKNPHGLLMGNSDALCPLDPVRAVGFAMGQPLQTTAGVISGRTENAVQIDAAINPGNSGGPVLDKDGKVVAIVVSGMNNAQNVNYACPIVEGVRALRRALYSRGSPGVTMERIASLNASFCNSSQALLQSCTPDCDGACITYMHANSCLRDARCAEDGDARISEGDFVSHIRVEDSPAKNFLESDVDRMCRVRVPIWPSPLRFETLLSRYTEGHEIRLTVHGNSFIREKRVFTVKLQSKMASFKRLYPPHENVPFVVFGGVVFMPLLVMHLQTDPQLAQRMLPIVRDERRAEKLIVIASHVHPESPMLNGSPIKYGDIITHLNGTAINDFKRFENELAVCLSKDTIICMNTMHAAHACTPSAAVSANKAISERLNMEVKGPQRTSRIFTVNQTK